MQTTKRHPRTLEEAFGPYARGGIYEAPTPLGFADKVIVGVCGVILFGLLIAICAGVI
ncbi:MAG: hypothetical protein ACK42H_07120 [Planctomycetota bacterium]|jgi:hypothetical protein